MVLFLFIFSIFAGHHSYFQQYADEANWAKQFYQSHQKQFTESGKRVGLKGSFLFGIVAPEVSQYNRVANFMELQSLQVLYVQGGSGYGNFSVGYFQMKPSFVEALEQQLMKHEDLTTKYPRIVITEQDDKQARRVRLDRLNDLNWQFQYLEVFCELVKKKHGHNVSAKQRLKYYATAYNTGFNHTKERIESEFHKSRFPAFGLSKYNYANVSYGFYKRVK
jgi:hypothetical protein